MSRYSLIQRVLHWGIAVIVLSTLGIGILLGMQEFKETVAMFGKEGTNLVYKYHKTFGVLILLLMAVRLVVRMVKGKPAYTQPLAPLERMASSAVHFLLYAALFAMPVLGWLATAAGGFPVEFFDWKLPGLIAKDKELAATLFSLHGLLGWAILGLFVLHVGGALKHRFSGEREVMGRMSLF